MTTSHSPRHNPTTTSSPSPSDLKARLESALSDPRILITPLNTTIYTLPFGHSGFISYLLSRPDVQGPWKAHIEHPFLDRLANGTLPVEAFKYYMIQDYLYLIHFARANALAAYKATSMSTISRSAEIILHIQREMNLHASYCAELGVSLDEINATEEDQACTAYTRYLLDVGMREDWFALHVALAPCLIGYWVIARRLYEDPRTKKGEDGNRYWRWIENYVAKDYTEAVDLGTELLNENATMQSPTRIEEIVKIFIHATNMEKGFWDMGFGKIGEEQ
ncbi:heme oxygenase-like protein [Zopfia rhizophila CBS 207.26]|uniref:Heme oxygenase-like protein n=1 Tax=Zopfia rhizophila CBS 207.26 TaxID=1314779 RepID=A0A6A6E5L9_9PEZI|nr:heme oxygenase-like protein [Zopfia rhizophila CBS 207.26]